MYQQPILQTMPRFGLGLFLRSHLASTTHTANSSPQVAKTPSDDSASTDKNALESNIRQAIQNARSQPPNSTSTFAGSLDTWLCGLSPDACAAMGPQQRWAILEKVRPHSDEVLHRLLCTPMKSPAMEARIETLASGIVTAVRRDLPSPPPVLRGPSLDQTTQRLLPGIQQAMGIPLDSRISHIVFEPLPPGTLARYVRFPSEQSGVPPSERLSIDSRRLESGISLELFVAALGHELTHKYQYLLRDALKALARTGLSLNALQAMTAAERLRAVHAAWPRDESRSLQNIALELLSNPETLATAQLISACIDHELALSTIREARTGSLLEQAAYRLDDRVQKLMAGIGHPARPSA